MRSPEATGSRSRGRRVQTLLSDRCSLDSPPRTVALRVATVSALLVLSPAGDRPTPTFPRYLRAVAFCRQTARDPRLGREARQAHVLSARPGAHRRAHDTRSPFPAPHAAGRRSAAFPPRSQSTSPRATQARQAHGLAGRGRNVPRRREMPRQPRPLAGERQMRVRAPRAGNPPLLQCTPS